MELVKFIMDLQVYCLKVFLFEGKHRLFIGFLVGRDASRAFISGDFTEAGLVDDVLDLPLQDLSHLEEWLKMYESKYEYKGRVNFLTVDLTSMYSTATLQKILSRV